MTSFFCYNIFENSQTHTHTVTMAHESVNIKFYFGDFVDFVYCYECGVVSG